MTIQEEKCLPVLPHYTFEAEVGVGGMGTVYKARDVLAHRDVAIKVLHESPHASIQEREDLRARFVQEAQLAKGFEHPNLVQVYDVFAVDDVYYLVMEYVSGMSLKQFLSGRLIRSGQHVIPLMIQACQGLAYAHEKGIIHRDIKPDNLFVTEQGVLKVMDFGIARQNTAEQFLTQTQPGMMLGTLNYMSPEQLQDTANVDPRSDVFSLGVVMYELFTGKQPFTQASMGQTMLHILSEDPPSPAQWNPRLSEDLTQVILKCLAKRRGQRYQNALALAEALLALQQQAAGLPQLSPEAEITGPVRSDSTQPTPGQFQQYLTEEEQQQLPRMFYHRASGLTLRCEAQGLQAFLSGDATYATETLTREHMARLMAEAGIVYGIQEQTLQKLVGETLFSDVLVAEGLPPQKGSDAYVHFLWQEPNPQPQLQSDGSVDHKQLNTVASVSAGTPLVRLTPAVAGQAGQTIYGDVIEVPEPKPLVLKEWPGTRLHPEDPLLLVADTAGLPVRLHQSARIVNVLELSGVNLKTGHIDFAGSVVIHGPVEKGFKVHAQGDIVVFGPVEGAELKSQGSIYVHQPVFAQSQLSARYHIRGIFCQGAELIAGGDCWIHSGLIHCQTRAIGRIILGPQGCIHGGEAYSAYLIIAHTVGTEAGHPTRLAVGRNPQTQWELEQLQGRQQLLNQRLQNNIKDMLYARTHQQLERLQDLEANRSALLFQVNTVNDEVRFFESQLKQSEQPSQCLIYAQRLGGEVYSNLCGTGRYFPEPVEGPLRLRQVATGLRETRVELSPGATIPDLWEPGFLPTSNF